MQKESGNRLKSILTCDRAMTIYIIIAAAALCVVLAYGIRVSRTATAVIDEYEGFMKSKITLPRMMLKIYDGEERWVDMRDETKGSDTYVVWFSKDDCTECNINHLEEQYSDLYRLQKQSRQFKVLYIMTPTGDNDEYIKKLIKAYHFEWPIYLDEQDAMSQSLPENKTFHMVYLSKEKKPLWIGKPFKDGKLSQEFVNATSTNKL